ncbi:hypothetical protein Tsubulata_036921 [Turnera subulata]|uniref:Wound-induced protein 1 n=1 Tax=Turnera subulata TaxID=218843 RepID=A0A9Q0JCB4_9ROSI|nr:hypothetical protein Tsubulata_036921 [Turnera subulata]
MNFLTGSSSSIECDHSFTFSPISTVAFGSMVLCEGFNKEWNISWVHAWSVTDGKITQVREYFNTSVVVTKFGDGGTSQAISSSKKTTSGSSTSCLSVWQSQLSNNKSVPGLVLAL